MRGYWPHHPNIRRCLLFFRTFSLIAARTPLFHGDRMGTTSEHSPPEARITLRVHLSIVSTAGSFQMPHSFALENCLSRVVQGARDHVFTSFQPVCNYYQYGSILYGKNKTSFYVLLRRIEMVSRTSRAQRCRALTRAPEETAEPAHSACLQVFFPRHGAQLVHPEPFRSCCILRSKLLAQALMLKFLPAPFKFGHHWE